MKSVGQQAIMFHGTWGYIHSPPPSFLSQLNPAELTIEALNSSLHAASKKDILPKLFAPTPQSTEHFELTMKLQLTCAVLK
jgi:hypothetical protein